MNDSKQAEKLDTPNLSNTGDKIADSTQATPKDLNTTEPVCVSEENEARSSTLGDLEKGTNEGEGKGDEEGEDRSEADPNLVRADIPRLW